MIIELKELHWLCKHIKNVRSSQSCVSINFCTESSSSMWLSLIHISIILLTETLFIFTIFVLMSTLTSICHVYAIYFSFLSLFSIWLIVWIQKHLFSLFFKIYPIFFWMITQMNNVNNFQIAKLQPPGVA